jgi:inhibitor of KinA sporulation pathway (predicted exonuclease)
MQSQRNDSHRSSDSHKSGKRQGEGKSRSWSNGSLGGNGAGSTGGTGSGEGLPGCESRVATTVLGAWASQLPAAAARGKLGVLPKQVLTSGTLPQSGKKQDESMEASSGCCSSDVAPPCRPSMFTKLCDDGSSKQAHIKRELRSGGGVSPTPVGLDGRCQPPESKKEPQVSQPFDYFLVLDFEATCEQNEFHFPHEIIEFPVIAVDAQRQTVVGEFHSFVKPMRRHGALTPFCKELTGISQADVDAAPPLPKVIEKFCEWFHAHFPEGSKVVFATDGPWDMREFMFRHSVCRDGADFPRMFYSFIDIRHSFCDHMKCKPRGVQAMLAKLGLTFEGRQHCGLHDARNIARILITMMKRGYRFSNVSKVQEDVIRREVEQQQILEDLGEHGEPSRHRDPHHKQRAHGSPQRGGSKAAAQPAGPRVVVGSAPAGPSDESASGRGQQAGRGGRGSARSQQQRR